MKNFVYAVTAVVSVALAAYCGYVFCTQTHIEGVGLESLIPAYFVLLFLSILFSDFAHEGMHYLVGLCCMMGVTMPKIKLFCPSSLTVCPKGAKHIKGRMLATASAGLIINLLCAVVGIIALFAPQVPAFLCVIAPYSIYSFAVNVAPFEYSDGKTDGLVVWELLSGADSAKVMLVILRVQGMMRSGVKLADIPESMLFEVPQLPEDDINFIILTQLRYEYYLEKGNDSEAYKYFMRYKELVEYLPSEYKDKK
ncbi:MAG: hypothetical protein ACI4L9_04875 [Candidatus Coproplasma sp.]